MPLFLKSIARLFFRRAPEPHLLGPPVPPTYTPAAEPPHAAGQLWLRPVNPRPAPNGRCQDKQYAESFKLAVDCCPSRTQGARNDNKLVLGPAGSGRSIVLARLTENAYEAGHHVVALTYTGLGPVAAVGERVGGRNTTFTTPEQATFNPFWFPEIVPGSGQSPTEAQLSNLASLLLALFQLTSHSFEPLGADGTPLPLLELLTKELRDYYRGGAYQATWGQGAWYHFDAFYELVTYLGGFGNEQVDYVEFVRWLDIVGLPYYGIYGKNPLGNLLNATPDQVKQLMDSPNRFLQFSLNLDESAMTEVDHEKFTSWPWGPEAPEAEVRVLLLLLHTAAAHLGRPEQRLTVVLDELHYSLVGPQFATYIEHYLATGQQQNRALLVAWHESPDRVFCDENPGAQALLAGCDTQLLMESRLATVNGVVSNCDCLQMSPATQALFCSLTSWPENSRKVLVRIPATGTGEVFIGALQAESIAAYQTKRERAMYERA